MGHTNQKTRNRADVTRRVKDGGGFCPADTVQTEAVRCDAPCADGAGRGATGYNRGTRPPTDRQLDVLCEVAAFRAAFGAPPTLRELCTALDIRSTNGVADHLAALEARGLLHYPMGRGVARGVMPTADGQRIADELIEARNEARGVDAA